LNVLLAEDNPVNQEVAVGLLEVLDCKVAVTENGRDAVEAVKRQAFDLILMDCQMPVMDGLEATRAIRETTSGARKVPIVALTANDIEAAKDDCLAAGMDDFLGKPFTLDDLTSLLDRWRPASHSETPAHTPSPSPASTSQPAANALDPAPIEALRTLDPSGERNLVERAIEKFLHYSDELTIQLAEAVDKGDYGEVARIAHSLKSSSANLGATDLSRQCAEIEALIGCSGPPKALDQRLVELREQHQLVTQELQRMIDGK
jgi:CheY-like chemotaxis protein